MTENQEERPRGALSDSRAHSGRPLYGAFAAAYDLIVPDRSESQTSATLEAIGTDGPILDAGCGTGRLLRQLSLKGTPAIGVDLSLAALREVNRHSNGGRERVVAGDLAALPFTDGTFGGVLCRGVLNDVLDDRQRDAIMSELSRVLHPAGRILLDVRDWQRTFQRYQNHRDPTRTVAVEEGTVVYRAHTEPDEATHRLVVTETIELAERSLTSEFVMRCWSDDEVGVRVGRAGLRVISQTFGDGTWAADRLVVVAEKSTA